MTVLDDVKKYYADLLILQYRNKPKARDTIKMGVDIYTGDGILLQLADCLNIDIAIGAQLDIIGKILGCPRNVPGINNQTKYFSFHIDEDSLGFSTIGNPSSGVAKNRNNSVLAIYSLTDEEYRPLLKFKAFLNVWRGDMGSMNDMLYNLFGYDLFLVNNQNLSITYQIARNTKTLQAAKILGYLKAPIGIACDYINGGWSPDVKIVSGNNLYEDLNGITYGNGKFVVTSGYSIFVSDNGYSFNKVLDSPPRDRADYVLAAFGDNVFVVCDKKGVLTSQDGINWVRTLSSRYSCNLVVYTPFGFFAHQEMYTLYHSTDGYTWSVLENQPGSFGFLVYSNGILFAIRSYDGVFVIKTTDGINWTTDQVSNDSTYCTALTFYNGTYYLYGQNIVYTSTDTVNWTANTLTGNNNIYENSTWGSVVYTNNQFIGTYSGDDNKSHIATSTDGIEWVNEKVINGYQYYGIGYSDNQVIVLENKNITVKEIG